MKSPLGATLATVLAVTSVTSVHSMADAQAATPATSTVAQSGLGGSGEGNLGGSGDSDTGTFDPVELYKALFFASGDAVSEVQDTIDDPSYNELVNEIGNDEHVSKTADDVVDRINDNDSEFFESFHEGITSGDPYQAEKALIEASETTDGKLNEIYEEELERHPELKEKIESEEATDEDIHAASPVAVAALAAAVAVVVVWSAGVAVNYGAAVNVGAGVNVAAGFNVTVKVNVDSAGAAAAADPESRNKFQERTANLTQALAA